MDGPTDRQRAARPYSRSASIPGVDRVQANAWECPLRELEWLGAITARQREAGELFEADHRLVYPQGGRDTLDMTVRGKPHETEAQAAHIKRAKARLWKVQDSVGIWYTAVRDLCVFRVRIKSSAATMPKLLDAIAEIYGLPRA